MPRVVHFEIGADDAQRASDFYKRVFGWVIQKWGGPHDYWMIKTGEAPEPGIDGGIVPRKGPFNTINTVQVDDVDACAAKVKAAGGAVVMPKMVIAGVGYLIYCQDTEKNMFGILQPDQAAK